MYDADPSVYERHKPFVLEHDARRLQKSGDTLESGGLTDPEIAAKLGISAREGAEILASRRSSGCHNPLLLTFQSGSGAGRMELCLRWQSVDRGAHAEACLLMLAQK